MRDFEGRVAVVTGAASGIGFAIASRFGAQRMKLVLADIETDALGEAARKLEKEGVEVLPVRTDVSNADDVQALAERARETFGRVHVLCNNAGVFTGGNSWEASLEDWQWVLGVNVWGVIHGLNSFVPMMLESGEQGHIVNTASMAAVVSMPYSAIYSMSKHAVLSLSESLYHELTLRGAKVGVSVLCPEAIATQIDRSERNRPPQHERAAESSSQVEARTMVERAITDAVRQGPPPLIIADRVLDAIRENHFYVLAGGSWQRAAETRLEDIRLARNPTFAPPTTG